MTADEVRVPAGLTTDGLLIRRYLAAAIDSVLAVIVAFAAIMLWSAVLPGMRLNKYLMIFVGAANAWVFWLGYFAVLESSAWQATVGKRLFGLRVYNSQGGRLEFRQAVVRTFVKEGPFLVSKLIPGGNLLSFLWLLAHLVVIHRSPVNQAIHDRVVHSWVAAREQTTQLRIG